MLRTILRLSSPSLRVAYISTNTVLSLPLTRSVNIRCRIVK